MRGGRGGGSMMRGAPRGGRGRPMASSGYQQQQQQPSYQQPTYQTSNYQQQVMPQSYNQQQVVPQIPQVQRVQPQQVMANTQSMNIPQIQNMNAPLNTMNIQATNAPMNVGVGAPQGNVQQQQQQQSQALNAQKPRSRPPIRTQNNDMFAQFNAPKQQQQQVPMQQQQQVQSMPPVQQQQQPQQPQRQRKPMKSSPSNQQRNEEKAQMISPNGASPTKKALDSSKSSKAMSSPKQNNRQPPWIQFTGDDKRKPIKWGWAHRVRQVLSADTMRIALLKQKGKGVDPLAPLEILQITLDGIEAPRTQRFGAPPPSASPSKKGKKKKKKKDAEEEDEVEQKNNVYDGSQPDAPFAYDAREFVRSKISNKNIFFAVWKSNSRQDEPIGNTPRNPRFWGDIYYQEGKGQTKSLTTELIANGYAKLKSLNIFNNLSPKEKKMLSAKEAEAKKQKLNVWSESTEKKEKSVRDIEWIQYENQKDFGEKYKGKVLNGIIDQVISGGTVRVELTISKKENKHVNVVVNIAGINAPKLPSKNTARARGKNQRNQPSALDTRFGAKAKEFCEDRLLGQVVGVRILFVSNSQIIAQIIHKAGRIGPALLRKGLAQYEAWTAKGLETYDRDEKKLLVAASEAARKAKINIWLHVDATEPKAANEIFVTVVEVISGDTVMVEYVKNKKKA